MADNIKVQAGIGDASVAPTVATDEVAGVHYQKVKIGWGQDGVWNETDEADNLRVPVKVGHTPVILTHTSATPGTTSGAVLGSNSARKYLFIQNIGSVDVYIKVGATAAMTQGICLYAQGGFFEWSPSFGNNVTGAINGIAASGAGPVLVTEGS